MKIIKLISVLLAVLMLAGTFTVIAGAEGSDATEPKYSTSTGNGKSNMKFDPASKSSDKVDAYRYKWGEYEKNGVTYVVSTPEEKIALMDYRYGDDKYELYVDAYSGEVAIKVKSTGETLFTNPYNIGQSTADNSRGSTKDELLSQLIVWYTDVKTDNQNHLNSYTMAAVRNQISVKNIQHGIRVEYSIGREESQSLVPHLIEGKAMEEIINIIETNMEAAIEDGTVSRPDDERHKLTKFKEAYKRFCLSDALNEDQKDEWRTMFPILEKFEKLAETDETYKDIAIYAIVEGTSERDLRILESLIKTYHKEYTYQNLQEAHEFVEYEAETENHPHFKMALEYTIEDTGLVVRLPANGIRFDETLFRLDYIEVLPFMGAGMNPNEGYTFFPDGSGTLFDFQDIAILSSEQTISGKIYGQDFAYHEPSGMYEEIIRYPVFGLYEKVPTGVDANGNNTYKDRGFTAIIEDGDALMELQTYHGGRVGEAKTGFSEYNTVKMKVYPRPTDSYNMADAISVGSNTEWTVVSARKYTGSYKVRYILLTDDDVAKAANDAAKAAGKSTEKYYTPSYVGMANAYRDYLIDNGVLSKLTANDVKNDIPLYIETFGALQTTERFLSIPVNVMTPLTTFEDITKMYGNLKDSGITNVNFIMKGFTKGGMTSPSVPYNLKWENAVSKEMDFDELVEDAKNNGYSLFPDFDFVYASNNTLFDGLTQTKHLAKTIDNRYTSRREYSATKHTYVSFFDLAISPAYFSHFYEKFIPKYAKYSPMGISVSTLGSDLNSDFDEDEPYNRADGLRFTQEALEFISNKDNLPAAQVMTSGGNAYSWKYVDHITDVALDSSRYSISSAAVPFLGIVLHGYVQTAGTPINMEGNLDYALLKAIENGSALKFILSYQNTEKLKEYETLSKYYSVNYSIWYGEGEGDLVTMYNELNSVIKDVQLSAIVGHEFVSGIRVPDDDELELDADQVIKDTVAYEAALGNANDEAHRLAIFNARQLIVKGNKFLKNAIDGNVKNSLAAKIAALKAIYDGTSGEYKLLLDEAEKTLEEFKAVQQYHAIYSDVPKNSFGDGFDKSYTVEDAIKAYEKYADAPTLANALEWLRWQKMLGADYSEKLVDMLEAKKAYEAKKSDKALKAAYDEATELLDKAIATPLDVDKLVVAMNNTELNTLKDAYIAAYNTDPTAQATEDARVAFEAKVAEVYGDLLTNNVYKITYKGVAVGGSQTYRDYYKNTLYKNAAKAVDEKLAELYEVAGQVKDAQNELKKVYGLEAFEKAYALIDSEKAYTDAERADLLELFNDTKTFIGTNADFAAIMNFDATASFTALDAAYKTIYDATDAAGKQVSVGVITDYEISGGKAETYFQKPQFTWEEKEVTGFVSTVERPAFPERNEQKYVSDDNMIVHETFENGKELLLNFNDFRVVVKLGETFYTVEAYGYVVVKEATKA